MSVETIKIIDRLPELAPGGRIAVSAWCNAASPGYRPLILEFERRLPEHRRLLAAVPLGATERS